MESNNLQLNEQFLHELFTLCIRKRAVFDLCDKNLKYTYLPHERYKRIWKSIKHHYQILNTTPTIGSIAQSINSEESSDVLQSMRALVALNTQNIISLFEEFIKRSMFVEAYDELGDLYKQDRQEDAYERLTKYGETIVNFTTKSNYYEKVFEGASSRFSKRRTSGSNNQYDIIPFGIPPLDKYCGGMDVGDTALFLAGSGVGKTKLLRHIGVTAARRGKRVLHIQAEGSKQKCLDGYDATWSGIRARNLFDEQSYVGDKLTKLSKIATDITAQGGEIIVEAFEQFDTASIRDIRNIAHDIRKDGALDLILIDYFELFDPGDGKRYRVSDERWRRDAVGKAMKNLAIEIGSRVATATQATDVNPSLANDPEFVLTRHHLSEFKAALKPFSFLISLNQTIDEYHDSIMRLYVDKMRDARAKQVVTICQNYDYDRFYDHKRTMQLT